MKPDTKPRLGGALCIGDRVRHVSGLTGIVKILHADLGVCTIELDGAGAGAKFLPGGRPRRSFELNTLVLVP